MEFGSGAVAAVTLGFLLGLKHATDAAHVVAVATIVSEFKNAFRSLWIGASWGIGHTAPLLVLGIIILIFKEVMNILSDPFFGVCLNPGHLIHRDEWMNSPIYKNSKEKIFSGQAFQMDIIPATNTNYFSANLEDGVVILNKEDREIFKDKYPEEMERIDKRREFIINQIGINLKPEVMPLSNIACYLSRIILNFSKAVVANN